MGDISRKGAERDFFNKREREGKILGADETDESCSDSFRDL